MKTFSTSLLAIIGILATFKAPTAYALESPVSKVLVRENAATLTPFSSYSLQCKQKVLQRLGWEITENPSLQSATIRSDRTCDYDSPAAVQRAHALQLSVPQLNTVQADRIFDQALLNQNTRCVYDTYLTPAVQRATKKLQDNHLYTYIDLILGSSMATLSFLARG